MENIADQKCQWRMMVGHLPAYPFTWDMLVTHETLRHRIIPEPSENWSRRRAGWIGLRVRHCLAPKAPTIATTQ